MYVYYDIVELSHVGNSQIPIMGLLPITTHFLENGHWVYNPPLYVKFKDKIINNINIKICSETGKIFPINDGEVICRLHFHRQPLLY